MQNNIMYDQYVIAYDRYWAGRNISHHTGKKFMCELQEAYGLFMFRSHLSFIDGNKM